MSDHSNHHNVRNAEHSHKGHGHNPNEAADIAAARMAMNVYENSNGDEQKIDWAEREKARIQKVDPRAWNKAADLEDEQSIKQSARQAADAAREAANDLEDAKVAARASAEYSGRASRTLGEPPRPRPEQAPAVPGQQAVEVPVIPGYDDRSALQPAPPASPAFYDQYGRPRPESHDIDLGIVKFGYNDGGSLEFGVNVGVAKVDLQAGAYNGVGAEFMPYGGPVHAQTYAGVGYDVRTPSKGFVTRAGAGGNFFNVVNGDANGSTHIGPDGIGTDGDLRGRVLPVDAQFDAGGNVGGRGAEAYTGGDVSLMHEAGVNAGGDFALGQNTRYAAGVGLETGKHLGNRNISLVSHIETNGDTTFQPKIVDVTTGDSRAENFYSTGDRIRDNTPQPGT